MSGRRSHSRFSIEPASNGFLRVLTDVVVHPGDHQEFVAISREPGVVGETLALQVFDGQGTTTSLSMRVSESRPLVQDGAVRHRLRLERHEH